MPSDPWLPIKTVTVHCVILRNHSYNGLYTNGEDIDSPCTMAWVKEDIQKRVNERFAQAGMVIEIENRPYVEDPPLGVDLSNGLDIGDIDLPESSEIRKIAGHFGGQASSATAGSTSIWIGS